MDTIKTQAINILDSNYDYPTADIALDIAQSLRAGGIVLSDETPVSSSGKNKLHKIKYASTDFYIFVPYGFEATLPYTYNYLEGRRVGRAMFA